MVALGIDKEKVMLQLERLERHLSQLKDISRRVKAAPEDTILLSAAERLLQVAIEDCLNIGNHIISGLGLIRPDTYREVFLRLKEAGVLPKELGDALEGFASFRNRLVHLYWEVSEEEIALKLTEIKVFKQFAQEIIKYLEARKGGG